MTMNAWTGFVTVLCVIVLIWLTLRIHAAAEQRRRSRQKPSPDGDAPENIHYAFSGNDLWGRLPSGDHSAHRHSGHSDGSRGSGMTAVATATAVVTAAAAFDDSRRRNPHLICRI